MSNKILEMVNHKPSAVIGAMAEGLMEQSQRPDFFVTMATFGDFDAKEGICYGCAATATIQKLFNKNFNGDNISRPLKRSAFLGVDSMDLTSFEILVDKFRSGHITEFLDGFNLEENEKESIENILIDLLPRDFLMVSDNWKEYIPVLREVVLELRKIGY